MAKILENIEKLASKEGISIGAMEKTIGASKGVLSRALANGTDIQAKWLGAIVENYPRYSVEWLLTGKGPMLKSELPNVAPSQPEVTPLHQPKALDPALELQRIPLYDIEAVAGIIPIFAAATAPIDYLSIPKLPPVDGAVYVRGDSMYPILKAGDIVLYKRISDIPDGIFWGEMYLLSFLIDDEEYVTIKFVQRSDRGPDYLRLVSQNPHHDPKDVPIAKLQGLAIVKASVRYNTIS